MSRQSNQSIGLLVIFCDVIKTMQDARCFAKVELQRKLSRLYEDAGYAVEFWPILTSGPWVDKKRREFAEFIRDLDKEHYPTVELVRMMERIVVDLIDFNPVGTRNTYVSKLLPGVRLLVDHVDPDGDHFQAFENCSEILDELYRIFKIDEKSFV